MSKTFVIKTKHDYENDQETSFFNKESLLISLLVIINYANNTKSI